MSMISPLITKYQNDLPTLVYVDYEYWRFSLLNGYGIETDIESWFQDLKSRGNIEEIYVFGDFSNPALAKDIPKLRAITNQIIDSRNPTNEKDYTDFIILDNIYQKLFRSPHVKQHIIFSGDGHFHSVASFSKNHCDKIVGVYAIKGNLNDLLRNTASWSIELVPPSDDDQKYRKALLQNLLWAERQINLIPNFSKTIEGTVNRTKLKKEKLTAILSKLIEDNYITQFDTVTSRGIQIRGLKPNWDLLKQHKLWDPDEKEQL